MEIVAMDMKLRGMYMARQLSFAGVTFDVREVSLSREFVDMYNTAVHVVSGRSAGRHMRPDSFVFHV